MSYIESSFTNIPNVVGIAHWMLRVSPTRHEKKAVAVGDTRRDDVTCSTAGNKEYWGFIGGAPPQLATTLQDECCLAALQSRLLKSHVGCVGIINGCVT